jgi:aspartate racemase
MKKIGIVGGVAWLSTVDYYAEICRRSERWNVERGSPGVPSTPEMSIESLDLNKAVSYLGVDGDEESWSQFDDYHRAALRRLEASGVEFALMASNTPHDRFASGSGEGKRSNGCERGPDTRHCHHDQIRSLRSMGLKRLARGTRR